MIRRIWEQLAIATNWPVLAAVAVLCTMGVISIWADAKTDAKPDAMKQLVFLGVSVVSMAAFQAVNYQTIGRWGWPFYIFSLLLILYTVVGSVVPVPGGHKVNGACAWITFGGGSIEPAELMKLAFVLVLGRYLRFRS